MFTNRFVLVIGVMSLLLVALALSRPFSKSAAPNLEGANDFYQRHPELVSNNQNAVVPITGNSEYLDYYQRHPELRSAVGIAVDITDYFFRHPELRTSTKPVDLTDYFFRHARSK